MTCKHCGRELLELVAPELCVCHLGRLEEKVKTMRRALEKIRDLPDRRHESHVIAKLALEETE